MIEAWAQSRLLTLDHDPETREPTVEVAHEALLREWPRLRAWLEEDRESIVALGHLREAAASWLALERDPGALYRGARLDVALQLAQDGARHLPAQEREFVEAGLAERERERQHELEQLEHTVRANRRLRVQLAALAVALVATLVIGAVAVTQRNQASEERQTATARELAAAANANLEIDPERSVLLALAAVDRARPVGGLRPTPGRTGVARSRDGVPDRAALRRRRWRGRRGVPTATGSRRRPLTEPSRSATGRPGRWSRPSTLTTIGSTASPSAPTVRGSAPPARTTPPRCGTWPLGDPLHRFDRPNQRPGDDGPAQDTGDDSLVPSFSADGTQFAFSWWTFDAVRLGGRCRLGSAVQEIVDARPRAIRRARRSIRVGR